MLQPFFTGLCPFREFLGTMLLKAPDDFLLSLDLPLLVFIFPDFFRFLQPFLLSVRGIIPFICNKLVVLDFEDPVHRLIQEIPVMGNDHNGSGIGFQILL